MATPPQRLPSRRRAFSPVPQKIWEVRTSEAANKSLGLLTILFCTSVAFSLLLPVHSQAQWFGGVGMGFGGAGLTKTVIIEDEPQEINRAEGPGMLHIFIDRTVKENWVLGFEHLRGYRLGPFTSGVGFTSLIARWHYLGIATDFSLPADRSQVFIKRWSPYTGFSTGLAFGDAVREASDAPKVSASGVHMGIVNGIDYLMRPDFGLRYEIAYHFTFSQSGARPASLTAFSLWVGLLLPLGRQKPVLPSTQLK